MNKIRSVVLLFLIGLLAGCATMQQQFQSPKVTLTRLSLEQASLLEQRYSVGLRVQNPNDLALPIAGMAYSFRVNGRELATGVSDQRIRLGAYDEQEITVSVTSNALDIVALASELSRSKADTLSLSFDGHVSVLSRSLRLPFSYQGNLTVREGRLALAPTQN